MLKESVDVVNDKDEVIGQATREEIYAKKLIHRIVHVFVIHPKTKQVYFQKRSEKNLFLPGYYCTSAGGHVKAGETYDSAAQRELKEELGIKVPLHKVCSLPFTSDRHKRFIKLFVAFVEDGFDFTDGEVASGRFFDLDEAFELIKKGEQIHPQLDVCYRWLYQNKTAVFEALADYFKNGLGGI